MVTWLLALGAMAQDATVEVTARLLPAEAPPPKPTAALKVTLLPGIGLAGGTDRPVDGVSVGFVTWSPAVRGVDAGLVTVVNGPVEGVQGGLVAVAQQVDVQGASSVAWAREVSALQLSGGMAVASQHVGGLQAAPLTYARTFKGAQLGLLNVAGDGQGVQVGLLNVAKTMDGPSFGLLNLVGDGMHHVDVWTSESAVANVGLKLGSDWMYTMAGVGYVSPGGPWWTAGGGLGFQIPTRPVWVQGDFSGWGVVEQGVLLPGVHGMARVQAGLRLAEHFSPFVGASFNTWSGNGQTWPAFLNWPVGLARGRKLASWPGLHAGLQF